MTARPSPAARAQAAARRLIARLGPSGASWKAEGRALASRGRVRRFWHEVQAFADLNTPDTPGDGLDTATRFWLGSERKKTPDA